MLLRNEVSQWNQGGGLASCNPDSVKTSFMDIINLIPLSPPPCNKLFPTPQFLLVFAVPFNFISLGR